MLELNANTVSRNEYLSAKPPSAPSGKSAQAAPAEQTLSTSGDSVELESTTGEGIAKRIARIRDQIARDEYLTPKRVQGAVDRLYQELKRPDEGGSV